MDKFLTVRTSLAPEELISIGPVPIGTRGELESKLEKFAGELNQLMNLQGDDAIKLTFGVSYEQAGMYFEISDLEPVFARLRRQFELVHNET